MYGKQQVHHCEETLGFGSGPRKCPGQVSLLHLVDLLHPLVHYLMKFGGRSFVPVLYLAIALPLSASARL